MCILCEANKEEIRGNLQFSKLATQVWQYLSLSDTFLIWLSYLIFAVIYCEKMQLNLSQILMEWRNFPEFDSDF